MKNMHFCWKNDSHYTTANQAIIDSTIPILKKKAAYWFL